MSFYFNSFDGKEHFIDFIEAYNAKVKANGEDDKEIISSILRGKVQFYSPEWDNISDDVKNLVLKMCCPPEKRLTAEQVLNETWVKDNAPNGSQNMVPKKNRWI